MRGNTIITSQALGEKCILREPHYPSERGWVVGDGRTAGAPVGAANRGEQNACARASRDPNASTGPETRQSRITFKKTIE